MTQQLKKSYRTKQTRRVQKQKSGSVDQNVALLKTSLAETSFSRYGVGFDVHKDTIATCICGQIASGEILEVIYHIFKNDPVGITELCSFLSKYTPVVNYLMECTGVYHRALYLALMQTFPKSESQIIAMNPLLVHRRIEELGNKNDHSDARTMAKLSFYDAILRPSYIGTEKFYQLRELIRSYHRNLGIISRLRNRIHRYLHSVNQKFPFDLSKEWALTLLDSYISKDWSLNDAFQSNLKQLTDDGKSGLVLSKHKEELIRFGEVRLEDNLRFLLQMDLLRFFHAEDAGATFLARAEQLVLEDSDLKQNYLNLLQIPGIGMIAALTILFEVGDYSRFTDCKAFVKFCGVIPSISESGLTHQKGHLNRCTNKFLRYSLCQAAGALINKPRDKSDLSNFASKQAQLKHLPHKKAMIKVANKLARIVYRVLVEKLTYNPVHETTLANQERLKKRIDIRGTILEGPHLRCLRRNIQDFLVSNYDFLNGTSKYHLKCGFHRLLHKAQWLEGKGPKQVQKK